MQNQIEACFDTDRGQTQYLLNNKIYVFLTPLSENKKKIHKFIIKFMRYIKKTDRHYFRRGLYIYTSYVYNIEVKSINWSIAKFFAL
ncbi:hypothetical protein RclHR1_01180018 [Rhizophagus clarus]|uniref:Uncharacterized protein n=1 Tax=Rhizophagus clarus TaxID=94130 RepID=A0A2Z6QKG9_9GLOM|nr:hypothetical protein RclHR1_01180018 [Rhizophagus clarus]GES95466.1 hypothetical protein RCL_e21432_RclHR1_01180018 [Rhizophagus clarus]